MARNPMVSIIMPAYNQAQFLRDAIDSVLNQTFQDLELIVVDDGSTDETPDILRSYGKRIAAITQKNSERCVARNCGLERAHGQMIAFLDADDLWYPEMLMSTASHLREHPETDLVCGTWEYVDESGCFLQPGPQPAQYREQICVDLLRTIITGNLFPIHTYLIRRKCFDCCGLFDTDLTVLEDWDLWLRMAGHNHKLDVLDVPVARYRRHSSCTTLDLQRQEQGFHKVLDKVFSNEKLAGRLGDLRVHAYICQWLHVAALCHERGLDEERRHCLDEAKRLYEIAPPNRTLTTRYGDMTVRFPESKDGFPWGESLAAIRAERDRYKAGLEAVLNKPPIRAYRAIKRFFGGVISGKQHSDKPSGDETS